MDVVHDINKSGKPGSPSIHENSPKDPIEKIHEMEREIEDMKHEIDENQAKKSSPERVRHFYFWNTCIILQ